MRILYFLALFLGCSFAAMAQKYVGGDISLLPSYEAKGAKYYDENGATVSDPLAFFGQKGMNAMRVRLFVNPDNAPEDAKGQGVCQDLDYVVGLAKQIKAHGMKLMLDFHYSDTWADPAKQWTPKAWLSLSDDDLADTLGLYTRRVLQRLKAEGATPDFIQTGNEISYGMMWGADGGGYGKACYPNSAQANWDRFAKLLTRATEACREECPEARIVIHVERVSLTQQPDNVDYAALTHFFTQMKSHQIDYDIVGLSYYPYFHGALSELEGAVQRLETSITPDKQIMLVETGYPYAWAIGGTTYDATSTWPYSLEGQRQFVNDLVAMLNRHKSVTGLFWWFMEANEYGVDAAHPVTQNWYNAPLFDNRTGRATPALGALRAFVSDPTAVHSVATASQTDTATRYTVDGRPVNGKPKKGVVVGNGWKVSIH